MGCVADDGGVKGKCGHVAAPHHVIHMLPFVFQCVQNTNQAFFYDHDAGEIANEAFSVCLGVC